MRNGIIYLDKEANLGLGPSLSLNHGIAAGFNGTGELVIGFGTNGTGEIGRNYTNSGTTPPDPAPPPNTGTSFNWNSNNPNLTGNNYEISIAVTNYSLSGASGGPLSTGFINTLNSSNNTTNFSEGPDAFVGNSIVTTAAEISFFVAAQDGENVTLTCDLEVTITTTSDTPSASITANTSIIVTCTSLS